MPQEQQDVRTKLVIVLHSLDIKGLVFVNTGMSIGFFKRILLSVIQERSPDGKGKPFFLQFNLNNQETIKTLIDKKIEYMRRVHAQFDDGKTIDVFLDLDQFDLPVWSETDKKFLILKSLKVTDTLD